MVTTVAGTGTPGLMDGPMSVAQFNHPCGVAIDLAGNIYVTDRDNHRICKITPQGTVVTMAGNGTAGCSDGFGVHARFNTPCGIAVDKNGTLFIRYGYLKRG
jgi:DNA-binding beta-propeller fold protein YncE